MNTKLKQIADHYGQYHQGIKTLEELGELQLAILGMLKGEDTLEHVTEEIADVYVMLLQLKYLFDISQVDVAVVMQRKIDRQLERIANNGREKNVCENNN